MLNILNYHEVYARKMAIICPYMATLSSQTIHACFAVQFRTQASTRFDTGEQQFFFLAAIHFLVY